MSVPPGSKEHELFKHDYPDRPADFTIDRSVDLPYPMDRVYGVLAPGDRMEPVVRLSPLCSDFFLVNQDRVALSTPLSSTRARTLPPTSTDSPPADGAKVLPRQSFSYEETIPLVAGLIKHKVRLAGTQTWDDDARVSLYETIGEDMGILIWKRREFEEIEGGGTRVKERIEGFCPKLMKFIVKSGADKSHGCVSSCFVLYSY